MTKFQLNNKVAELYKIKPSLYGDENMPDILLIDDWNRLMDLAVDNKIFEVFECRQTDNYFSLKNRANLQYTIIFILTSE